MIKRAAISATFLPVCLAGQVEASTYSFDFEGSGVRGEITLTYGPNTDAKYPQAYAVTGITGTFTDLNNGLNIIDAPITGLVPITRDTPHVDNTLAPNDFSRFAVATGLPPINGGFLTYDNLFYPGGSPQTASDYPFEGGFLDIYGLLFEIGGGRVVNFWSNGHFIGAPSSPVDYGVAVATSSRALDYVGSIPEPNVAMLFGLGFVALLSGRRVGLAARTE